MLIIKQKTSSDRERLCPFFSLYKALRYSTCASASASPIIQTWGFKPSGPYFLLLINTAPSAHNPISSPPKKQSEGQEGQCLRDTGLMGGSQRCYFLYSLPCVCHKRVFFNSSNSNSFYFTCKLLQLKASAKWLNVNVFCVAGPVITARSSRVSNNLKLRRPIRSVISKEHMQPSRQYYNFLFQLTISSECHSRHKHSFNPQCRCNLPWMQAMIILCRQTNISRQHHPLNV